MWTFFFYFLISYVVCKKKKSCNGTIEKKNSPFEEYLKQKMSVCLSVRQAVCLSVYPARMHNNL